VGMLEMVDKLGVNKTMSDAKIMVGMTSYEVYEVTFCSRKDSLFKYSHLC